MKIFIDSADINEIKELNRMGAIDGVTTNPSLVKKSGSTSMKDTIIRICDEVNGPVSAEVLAVSTADMVKEGRKIAAWAPNVVVKLPATFNGIKTCSILSREDILVNVTLCFSMLQALLAAKAGAYFISPFVGRLDDIGINGMNLINDICEMYSLYNSIHTQVLVASIRNLSHVQQSALLGADAVTVPLQVIKSMYQHNLTDKGLQKFLDDCKDYTVEG